MTERYEVSRTTEVNAMKHTTIFYDFIMVVSFTVYMSNTHTADGRSGFVVAL